MLAPQARADFRAKSGARRDRTADLLRATQALSQLSYGPLVPLKSRDSSLNSSALFTPI